MSVLPKSTILSNIASELADNNAGQISAYDVRHNLTDIVDSINQIVASGDFDAETPFSAGNVRAKIVGGQHGKFIAESGVVYPYGDNGGLQIEAYPGAASIQHNDLAGLTTGDPHIQYLPLNGGRVMADNLGLGNNWLNASGNSDIVSSDNRGLKFETLSSSGERVHVGNATHFRFNADSSNLATAKGIAKAWINFDASGVSTLPEVRSSYNVKELQKLDVGKFKIIFNSGVFKDNNYVAVGNSTARGTDNSPEDFDINTVGMVSRSGDDASVLRSMTFCVLNDGNQFVDAAINELVVYGLEVGESSGVPPLVTVL